MSPKTKPARDQTSPAPAGVQSNASLSPLGRVTTILWYGARKYSRDRTPLLAAALAYRTVFSLIPMLVLGLVAVRAFSSPEAMRSRLDALFNWLALNELTLTMPAGTEGGEPQVLELDRVIDQFVEQSMTRFTDINLTAITAVGIGILIYAALSLLIQIEQAFNTVYGASAGRKILLRLTNYWTLLTLGSLALFISFAVSESLTKSLADLPASLSWISALSGFLTTIGVTWILLLFAYVRMPTTRVRLRPAAIGAIIAAVLWELAKKALTEFVGRYASGQVSVYGSLALIPLFLLWIQITWMIVLLGLQISYALQNFSNAALLKAEESRLQRDPLVDPAIGVILMCDIAQAFRKGKPRPIESLADGAGITQLMALPILERLSEVGLLNKVERGADEDAFALARPAGDITVNEILGALRQLIPDPRGTDEARILDRILDRRLTATEGLSLADLANSQPRPAS